MKTLIKIVAVFAVIACVVSLFAACNSGEEEDVDSDGIFCVTYKNAKMELGKSAAGLIDSLGTPKSVNSAQSCGPAGEVKQYEYVGITINILTDDKNNSIVDQIVFTDDSVSTSKGICIGDSAEKVVNAHGTPTKKTNDEIEYESGSCLLRFQLNENGEVKKITYFHST